MRKTTVLTWTLATACALSACGTQAGHSATGAATTTSATSTAFKDVSDLAVALKAQSLTKNSTHVTLTGSAGQQNMTGSGDFRRDAAGLALNMTMTTSQGEMAVTILDNAFYIKMPPSNQVQPGKPWLKITANGTDPLSKALAPVIKSAQQNTDFTSAIDQINTAGVLTKSAPDKLDGADVTHYWITIDMVKLAQAQTDPTLKDAMQKAVDGGAKTTNEQLWVSKDNLPVKAITEVPTVNGATAAFTVTYSDWGKPVTITAPPASEIAQMPNLGG